MNRGITSVGITQGNDRSHKFKTKEKKIVSNESIKKKKYINLMYKIKQY